jgi:hypothetical protein
MNARIMTAVIAAVATAACGSAPDPSESSANGTSALTFGGVFGPVLPRLTPTPPTPGTSGSTIPNNGDVNPYGVAFVPPAFPPGGILKPGDVIVANFNNSGNAQGTGTTIVRVNPNASPSLFFTSTPVGLSTALGVLQRGFVLVGNLPSTDGSGSCTPGPEGEEEGVGTGVLQVIDRHGMLVQTLSDPKLLNSPWDLTVVDEGAFAQVFVSNELTGTVTRLDLLVEDDGVKVLKMTQIASGYLHRCDMNAFVVGPTGVAFDQFHNTLYVASAGDNAIFAIANAGTTSKDAGMGTVVVNDATHLHGPLGLVQAPNGNLISAQGDAVNPDVNQPSEIVEFTRGGKFVAQFSIDPVAGSAFGLALTPSRGELRFAAVDDGLNVLDTWVTK